MVHSSEIVDFFHKKNGYLQSHTICTRRKTEEKQNTEQNPTIHHNTDESFALQGVARRIVHSALSSWRTAPNLKGNPEPHEVFRQTPRSCADSLAINIDWHAYTITKIQKCV